MKAGPIIKDYFTFTQKEQRGVVVLIGLFFCLLMGTLFFPLLIPDKPVDFTGFEKEVDAFIRESARLDSLELLERRNKYKNSGSYYLHGVADTGRKFPSEAREKLVIELNSADTFELQRLHGIGSSFAKRIVRYRERLGGFYNKSQVKEVWGMDSSRYNKIAENLVVNPDSVHRINLNTVTFKALQFHPYFPFEVTKAIMIYRKEHKAFLRLDELKSIPGIRDSTYQKIIPYLSVGEGGH